MKRSWLAIAALMGLGGCFGLPPTPPPTNPIRFLSINDLYVADTLADGRGGLARVATLRNRLQSVGPTLFVLAGDELSPSLLSKYYSGRQMVDELNTAKLDYVTFGNHEFEIPRDTLVARIAQSKFKWVSSNCTEGTGAPFPGVLPWDTVTVQGKKIGLFALTLKGDYRRYVRCTDPDSAAHIAVDTLRKLGARLIVGLTHQTLAADKNLLTREPAIDLILGGHEHEAHDETVTGRHVLKADANVRSAQFVTVWGDSGNWRVAPTLVQITSEFPLDTATARVVAGWQDSLKRRLGPERVIGTITSPIEARDAASRRGESAIGDLVTDAFRSGTGADVALLNSGTLRLDDVIKPGPLTSYTIESLFLFADETRVVTFPLTGARLREVLEHGVAPGSVGAGPFLQVSGITFAYDSTRPAGSRIVGDVRRADGRIVAPGDVLKVAFDVYPACEAGDGYKVPEAASACAAWQTAPRGADLLTGYVTEKLGGSVAPPAGGRITLHAGT
jgi:2',3'-cyclic-nucleotide 2'-phosphodiesterase (5'-nucleotidase family)